MKISKLFTKTNNLKFIYLSFIFLLIGFSGGYLLGVKNGSKQQPKSLTVVTDTAKSINQSSLESGQQQKSTIFSTVQPHKLSYFDSVCQVTVQFPQITKEGQKIFFWFVDASDNRTVVLPERVSTGGKLDYSVIVYAKQLSDNSPYYESSVEVVCGKNNSNTTLQEYLEESIKPKITDEEAIGYTNTKIGEKVFGKAILTIIKTTNKDTEDIFYRGIYKGNLILITNSNKRTGILQSDAESIINSIVFE